MEDIMKPSVIVPAVIRLAVLLAGFCIPIHGYSQDTIPVQHPPQDTTAIGAIPVIEDETLPEPPAVTTPPQVNSPAPTTRDQSGTQAQTRTQDGRRTTAPRPVVASPTGDSEIPPPPPEAGTGRTNTAGDGRRGTVPSVATGDSIQAIAQADSIVYAAYTNALRAYYEGKEKKYRLNDSLRALVNAHQEWTRKNRQSAMNRQQFIGIVVFCVAVGLVVVGVIFAWMQFRIAMRHAKAGEAIPASTIKASMGSIEVSSSVLGVVILALSLVFFYLYLRYVFQLTVLPG